MDLVGIPIKGYHTWPSTRNIYEQFSISKLIDLPESQFKCDSGRHEVVDNRIGSVDGLKNFKTRCKNMTFVPILENAIS